MCWLVRFRGNEAQGTGLVCKHSANLIMVTMIMMIMMIMMRALIPAP